MKAKRAFDRGIASGLVYAAMLPELVRLAEMAGYALALHGSLQRDLDVIAVAWADDAAAPEALVESLALALSIYGGEKPQGPEAKPHGRLAWLIPMGCGLALDLSVMPPREKHFGGTW